MGLIGVFGPLPRSGKRVKVPAPVQPLAFFNLFQTFSQCYFFFLLAFLSLRGLRLRVGHRKCCDVSCMTAESKQTHNDFETEQAEQNDFNDFEILRSKKGQRPKSSSGWAEAVEVVLRVRITTVSWTSQRKKRKTSVDITVTKAGTSNAAHKAQPLFKPSFVQRLSDLLPKLLLDCAVCTLKNPF